MHATLQLPTAVNGKKIIVNDNVLRRWLVDLSISSNRKFLFNCAASIILQKKKKFGDIYWNYLKILFRLKEHVNGNQSTNQRKHSCFVLKTLLFTSRKDSGVTTIKSQAEDIRVMFSFQLNRLDPGVDCLFHMPEQNSTVISTYTV